MPQEAQTSATSPSSLLIIKSVSPSFYSVCCLRVGVGAGGVVDWIRYDNNSNNNNNNNANIAHYPLPFTDRIDVLPLQARY